MADDRDARPVRRQDEAPHPGGRYIRGARPGRDGKHYGGQVVDADGRVLAEFGADEVNTGLGKDDAQPVPVSAPAPAPHAPAPAPAPAAKPADVKAPAK